MFIIFMFAEEGRGDHHVELFILAKAINQLIWQFNFPWQQINLLQGESDTLDQRKEVNNQTC